MLRNPAYAAISVFTLAVGIGLTGMVFSIPNGALLKGLPFDEGHRLMSVSHADRSRGLESLPVPFHDFAEWRDQQSVFEDLAHFNTGTFNIRGTEGAERFDGAWVTATSFDLLGARPILGRNFAEGEDLPGAAPVAIISGDSGAEGRGDGRRRTGFEVVGRASRG